MNARCLCAVVAALSWIGRAFAVASSAADPASLVNPFIGTVREGFAQSNTVKEINDSL